MIHNTVHTPHEIFIVFCIVIVLYVLHVLYVYDLFQILLLFGQLFGLMGYVCVCLGGVGVFMNGFV